MLKHTQMLGTVCVLAAALAAGPAAADTLTGFAATLGGDYTHNDVNNNGPTAEGAGLGGSVAGPLGFPGLNIQADADYQHVWASNFSAELWDFGGSAFFAASMGRVGANFNYFTETNAGQRSSGGAFGEYYLGQFTLAGKGGWNFGTGGGAGGHGNYLGADVTGYLTPDLSLNAAFNWDTIMGGSGTNPNGPPLNGLNGRGTLRTNTYSIFAEYLLSPEYSVSLTAGYSFTDGRQSALAIPGSFGFKENENTFWVGLKWYLGAGSLEDHQRNGTLMPWLTGPGNGAIGPAL